MNVLGENIKNKVTKILLNNTVKDRISKKMMYDFEAQLLNKIKISSEFQQ